MTDSAERQDDYVSAGSCWRFPYDQDSGEPRFHGQVRPSPGQSAVSRLTGAVRVSLSTSQLGENSSVPVE